MCLRLQNTKTNMKNWKKKTQKPKKSAPRTVGWSWVDLGYIYANDFSICWSFIFYALYGLRYKYGELKRSVCFVGGYWYLKLATGMNENAAAGSLMSSSVLELEIMSFSRCVSVAKGNRTPWLPVTMVVIDVPQVAPSRFQGGPKITLFDISLTGFIQKNLTLW